jgi:serine/threonine protein kinase
MQRDDDARIDEVVADYVDRLNVGEKVDRDSILAEHPELGAEILRRLETFVDIDEPVATERILGALGDYTLRRQIGRGGMGVVYEAWQGSMDRRVALKVLPRAIAADRRAVARFVQEAQLAGSLNHPNIVTVHGMGVEEQVPYFAMEYVEGETLAALIRKRGGILPELPEILRLAEAFAAVADGLHHAHARKVIHRDIKPSNLILDRSLPGNALCLRLLDFGLARLEGQEGLTQSGDLVGTPQYMSPEQARRKKVPVDHRTDVYSLGATLYEVLCGRPPFLGKDHADTLSQIIERDPVEPKRLNTRVPKELETIVLKCLRKEAAERYGTAEAMGQDLRRFVRGEAVEARPEGRWERSLRLARSHRQRLFAVLGIILVLLLASISAALLLSSHRQRALARYEKLIHGATCGMEVAVLTAPGQLREGEQISLGLVPPREVGLRQQVAAAVEKLEEAQRLCPERPEAPAQLFRAYRVLGLGDEAERALLMALRIDEEFLPALLLRAHALREAGLSDDARRLEEELRRAGRDGWKRDWLEAHQAAVDEDWGLASRRYVRLIREHAAAPPFIGFELELRLRRGRVALRRGSRAAAIHDFSYVREASGGAAGPSVLLAKAYYETEDRDAAAAVLAEAVEELGSDETRELVVSVLLYYSDGHRARQYAEAISDPCRRAINRIRVLRSDGQRDEALAVARDALGRGCTDPDLYAETSTELMGARRQSEAVALLTDGARRTQNHETVIGELTGVLYFLCRFDEVIALVGRQQERRKWANILGWAHFRKGDLERAIEALTLAIELDPLSCASFGARSRCRLLLGNMQGAIADEVQAASADPAWEDGRNLRRYYSRDTRHLYEPLWSKIDAVCAAAVRRRVAMPRYLGLKALACVYGREPRRELALELAQQAAAASGELAAEGLGYLGEVHEALGDKESAVRVLERAVRLPFCWRSSADDLARLRRELFPRLVSCASIDDFVERGARGELEAVRAALEAPALRRYFEACLLEEAHRFAEAAAGVESVVEAGVADDAAILRLAWLRARSGHRDESLTLIESRFLQPGSCRRLEVPAAWLRVALQDPPLSHAQILERLHRLRSEASTWVDDLIWLVESLAQGAIRINCGGSDHVDVRGTHWGRDRFFLGGRGYARTWPDTSIAEDRDLYYPQRHFKSLTHAVAPGYSIPVPAGRYRVTLWIAETNPWPLPTRFAIEAEGQALGEKLEGEGVGALVSKEYEVEVVDGALDLHARPVLWLGWFNAIEIVPVPTAGR